MSKYPLSSLIYSTVMHHNRNYWTW